MSPSEVFEMCHGGKRWELFLQPHGSPSSQYPSVVDVSPSWSRLLLWSSRLLWLQPHHPPSPVLGTISEPPFLDSCSDVCPSPAVACLQCEHEHPHQLPPAGPVAVRNSSHCLGGRWSSPELWPIHRAPTDAQGPLLQMLTPAAAAVGVLLSQHHLVPGD